MAFCQGSRSKKTLRTPVLKLPVKTDAKSNFRRSHNKECEPSVFLLKTKLMRVNISRFLGTNMSPSYKLVILIETTPLPTPLTDSFASLFPPGGPAMISMSSSPLRPCSVRNNTSLNRPFLTHCDPLLQGGVTKDLHNEQFGVTLYMRPGSDGCVTWIMRALEEQPKAGKLDDLLDTMLDEAPVTVSDMGRVMKMLGEQRRWRRLLQVRLTAFVNFCGPIELRIRAASGRWEEHCWDLRTAPGAVDSRSRRFVLDLCSSQVCFLLTASVHMNSQGSVTITSAPWTLEALDFRMLFE